MMTMMIKRAVIVFVVAATVPDPPSLFVAGFSNLSILPPSPCSVAAKGSRRDGGNFGDSHSSHCHQRQPGGRRRRQDWSSGRASLHGLSVAISTPPSDAGDSKENTTTTTGGGGQPDYVSYMNMLHQRMRCSTQLIMLSHSLLEHPYASLADADV